MQIKDYINKFEENYSIKRIDFSSIINYFSAPDIYGKNIDIETVSEHEICSDQFITLIVDGKSIDRSGKYDWGTKAIIIFVEFNKANEVINACIISSFIFKDKQKEKHLYDLLESYHEVLKLY